MQRIILICLLFTLTLSAGPLFLDYRLNCSFKQQLAAPGNKGLDHSVPVVSKKNARRDSVGFSGGISQNHERIFFLERESVQGGRSFAPAREKLSVVDTEVLKKQYDFEIVFFGNNGKWSVGIHGQNTSNNEFDYLKKERKVNISRNSKINKSSRLSNSLVSPLEGDSLEFYTEVEINF